MYPIDKVKHPCFLTRIAAELDYFRLFFRYLHTRLGEFTVDVLLIVRHFVTWLAFSAGKQLGDQFTAA